MITVCICPHLLSWGTSYVVPRPGPEVRKLFSCSTQLSMKFVLFINLKILTKVLNFFHAQLSWASSAELSMKKVLFFWYFYLYDQVKFHAELSWAWKKFYNFGAWINYICIQSAQCLCISQTFQTAWMHWAGSGKFVCATGNVSLPWHLGFLGVWEHFYNSTARKEEIYQGRMNMCHWNTILRLIFSNNLIPYHI